MKQVDEVRHSDRSILRHSTGSIALPKSAWELLSPEAARMPDTRIAWAVFGAAWYLQTYPEAAAACDNDPEAALPYYFSTGCRLGHSPSPLFDEAFYLQANPDIAALVEDGQYRSGFDHFCQYGHRALSPHLLFDDALYASYEDMTLENLDRHHCFGRYDHYLKSGQRETRMAHFLFDAQFYRARAIAAGIAAGEIDQDGPFVHYLYGLEQGATELACSPYFEPGWYVETYPLVAEEIAKGHYRSALHHYLCNNMPRAFDPVAEYSERFYLEAHPDIAESVEAGNFRTGYQHFVQYGAFELRRPRADIDLIYYRDMNPAVCDDINSGRVRDAFAHLRLIGLADDLPYCPPESVPDISEMAAKQLFLLKARNALALHSRRTLDFICQAPPRLSVIMVLYNKFELTMLALSSLRDNFHDDIDLILVDNASTDDTARLATYVQGAVLIRTAANLGFLRACNLALEKVSAPVLLYLNNDVELGHGCIEAGLARIASDAKIGAVGGKVIRTHGRLQEAGCIIWADGSTSGYLRDASPLAPEANFVRDVDFCSGVFLMCGAALVRRLGGFDEAFSPAYYEESDLCVRMIEAGYRVVYDPAVTVQHLEYGSAATTEASLALMRRGHRTFRRKHEAFLESKQDRRTGSTIAARALNEAGRHILFLEDTVPVRRLGSGFTRANDVVWAMAAAGCQVSVLPVNGARHDIMSLFGDLPDTVEVLHDRTIMTLAALLRERQGYYDLVWISRTHNLDRVLPVFREAGVDPARTPFILDTEAIEAARNAEAALINAAAGPFDFDSALRREFANAGACRHITAVNEAEAALLRRSGLFPVSVLGTIRAPQPTPRDFAGRTGLLFVGSIHQADSPNLDSLRWYADEILPALAAAMAAQGETVPKLTVVGYSAPEIDLTEFADNPHIELRGAVDDLAPVYDSHRVFVAPTRFAAGTPYKVYETASFGLPCVATDLLVRQLGWRDGDEITAAPVQDAAAFARQVARLYCSELLWRNQRATALRRLTRENGKAAFEATVSAIISGALKHNSANAIP
jgi:GT2 family glycosyltransferase/glycosyltransferase involved in cell wall biosynthesis